MQIERVIGAAGAAVVYAAATSLTLAGELGAMVVRDASNSTDSGFDTTLLNNSLTITAGTFFVVGSTLSFVGAVIGLSCTIYNWRKKPAAPVINVQLVQETRDANGGVVRFNPIFNAHD